MRGLIASKLAKLLPPPQEGPLTFQDRLEYPFKAAGHCGENTINAIFNSKGGRKIREVLHKIQQKGKFAAEYVEMEIPDETQK